MTFNSNPACHTCLWAESRLLGWYAYMGLLWRQKYPTHISLLWRQLKIPLYEAIMKTGSTIFWQKGWWRAARQVGEVQVWRRWDAIWLRGRPSRRSRLRWPWKTTLSTKIPFFYRFIKCSLVTAVPNQVCENDKPPQDEKLVMVLENDNKETCQTSNLDGEITNVCFNSRGNSETRGLYDCDWFPGRGGHVREYSAGQLGDSCSRFQVPSSNLQNLKSQSSHGKAQFSGYRKPANLGLHNTW